MKLQETHPEDSDAESVISSADLQNAQEEAMTKQKATLARQETKAVSFLRPLVVVSLLLTAALLAAGVYTYAHNDEQEEFEAGFEIHASKIIESFHDAVEQRIGAIGTLSDDITTYAQDMNESFPYVTVSNFAIRGANLRVHAEALIAHWAPVVTEENRNKWEEYAMYNRFQINDAFDQDTLLRENQDNFFGLTEEEKEDNQDEGSRFLQDDEEFVDPNILQDGTGYHKRIYMVTGNKTVEADGTGPYLPLWQRSPVTASRQINLNLNFATTPVFKGILPQLMKDPKAIINKVVLPLPFGQKQITSNLIIGQYRHDSEQYLEDPISFMAYPVFDSFDEPTKKLAGVLITNLYWRLYFTDVLSTKAKGIIAVLENSYNQTFAYRINGPEVTFLGAGDPHLSKYNAMEVSEDVTATVNSRAGPETRSYTTVGLSDSFGVYTLRVYPSQDTEDEYKSNKPVIYTVVVALIFLFTSMVFLVFDYLVERRQKVVMNRAAQSGALVSSLFPEQVQDRLYAEPRPSKDFKADNPAGLESMALSDQKRDEKQIADAYESVTIMFADLAGFTKWSSTRSPGDVFDLLESLYSAFDGIALKRGVFKVETIGDCYLAACGLPEPNPNHAVVMAKFSRDCMVKMNEIVRKVSDRLGQDTCNLRFRVGLHSGSVTAGILRGQKARFQLFGDTVNTASRMESTGQPGRIHVSEQTAQELRVKGKGSWLTQREDKVVAKGKGELSTFWVDIRGDGSGSKAGTDIMSVVSDDSMPAKFVRALEGTKEGADEGASDEEGLGLRTDIDV